MCSSWWNEKWQRKLQYSEKTEPSGTLSITNAIGPELGKNPGCCDEKYLIITTYQFIYIEFPLHAS
jgi:hypothetical protein